MKVFTAVSVLLATALAAPEMSEAKYFNEYKEMAGHTVKNSYKIPLPHTYVKKSDLPEAWDWRNVEGKSMVTRSLNQHIPQYCGSCWAHGAMSSLADRIKIARKGTGDEINLAIQFILNCGTEVAGSCHGGSHTGAFQFVKNTGYVPYDSCLQYEACSAESKEGNCKHGNYECSKINTCRTCSSFSDWGGFCSEVDLFPNATIAEYGEVPGDVNALKAEIYKRGPVACGVNAEAILKYQGGIVDMPNESREINHIVSTVGWGKDESGEEYWIIRNSWGQYWGELGYFRVKIGGNQLGVENSCAWATPGVFTEVNFPCNEDGSNCVMHTEYRDPFYAFIAKDDYRPVY